MSNDPPEGTSAQRRTVLGRLRAAGTVGVSVHDLVYRDGITRAAARVLELREAGFVIDTIHGHKLPDGRTELARYVLRREPPGSPEKPGQAELWG